MAATLTTSLRLAAAVKRRLVPAACRHGVSTHKFILDSALTRVTAIFWIVPCVGTSLRFRRMDIRNIVTFHYTLRDPSGALLDTSAGGTPIAYLEGAGQIIDGLDEALRGLPGGTKQRVQVAAARAYGLRDETQVQRVPRSALPVEGELAVGAQFQAGPDRHAPVVTVVAVEGDAVVLDANHPLAGVDLTFEVEIVAVRPATPEELKHGQPHCGDGCGCG